MPNDVAENPLTGFESLDDAAKVGAGLRAVRERLGWALADVAEALRIRLPFLEAIERGDLRALPGAAYQTGFVRSYAQILDLDPEEILRRFRAAGLGAVPDTQLSFLAPVPDRAVPAGAVVLLGVMLVLVGYGLWYRHTEHERRLAAMVPSVPVELAPLAVPPKLPAPPAPKPAIVKPASPPPAQQPAIAAALPAAVAPMPLPPDTVTIMATQDDWVEVQDATGNILFSKVLHAGESWPVPDLPGLTMITGNAGGTEIVKNGQAGAPLGAPGTVLHGYVLTPQAANAAQMSPAANAAQMSPAANAAQITPANAAQITPANAAQSVPAATPKPVAPGVKQ